LPDSTQREGAAAAGPAAIPATSATSNGCTRRAWNPLNAPRPCTRKAWRATARRATPERDATSSRGAGHQLPDVVLQRVADVLDGLPA
jgi:hypothetical protein